MLSTRTSVGAGRGGVFDTQWRWRWLGLLPGCGFLVTELRDSRLTCVDDISGKHNVADQSSAA
ncbi:hypothetical protein F4560_001106 [Saccharothrix ecbatanensis]|uniref:Uncharacterized protein n=1 Tax=Saccharothrix ecbatanensis TaxID=1105145 RepID=A0A7W9HG48_9PSEU|nr:hypothetical protein [Saccharothrix ecbatanensis]MBB5801338.1 hypothetical protein [Saccharothrix ecbatanensis]